MSQPFSPGIGSRPATFLSMALGKSQGSEIHLAYVGAGSDQNALAAAHSSWLGWVQVWVCGREGRGNWKAAAAAANEAPR